MNKNLVTVLLILFVPLCVYWGLTQSRALTTIPSFASSGAEIIKFSSPMCYECQELEKIFKEVYPNYSNEVGLRKIDVTQKDKITQQLIKEYNVKLVPTCVFKDSKGDVIRTTEGMIQPKILENYIKEQLNG
ncbi:MAG: thioredoxin family protein [bacterium]|nr:thioredoxin family protein [bacterium]